MVKEGGSVCPFIGVEWFGQGGGVRACREHARERAERTGWCLGRPDHRPVGAVSCGDRVGRDVGLAGRLDGLLHRGGRAAWPQEPCSLAMVMNGDQFTEMACSHGVLEHEDDRHGEGREIGMISSSILHGKHRLIRFGLQFGEEQGGAHHLFDQLSQPNLNSC